ncbi:recombinase family protein [Streptomyces sp. NPDC086080]|uniref:recombinase family protein n=1 Tax=Streptomyces sp. NPDC086080 TaxID=3365748 RepID=UPI0037CE8774
MRKPQGPRRVIGYARISRATDESTSIERQRELIRTTCQARGWALAEIVEDVDVSATKSRDDHVVAGPLLAGDRSRRDHR